MRNLFEYIFVDPLAIWDYPDLLKQTSIRYGFILVNERTQTIDEQIEELVPINDENRWKLDRIRYLLTGLRANDAVVNPNFYSIKTMNEISNKDIRPKFLQDTDAWAQEVKVPYLCIVSEENTGQKVADPRLGFHLDPLQFQKIDCQGKDMKLEHDSRATAKILSRILQPQIFNRCVHQIDIVDYQVQTIGIPPFKRLYNYLSTIEEMSYSLYEKYFNNRPQPSTPMKINIFFRNDKDLDLIEFAKNWDDHIKKIPRFSKLNGKLEIQFFCLSYKDDGRKINVIHDRWCFSKSFLLGTQIGICSKPGGVVHQKGRIKWKLIPTEENKRLPDQEDYLELIQKWFCKNSTEYNTKHLTRIY